MTNIELYGVEDCGKSRRKNIQVESSLDREDYFIIKNLMDLFQEMRDDRDCEKRI